MKKFLLTLVTALLCILLVCTLFACGEENCNCEDNDRDHYCDLCGNLRNACYDADHDHSCDYCGAVIECYDSDNNHYCQLCNKELSVCIDENQDDDCDICGELMIDFNIKLLSDDTYAITGYTGDDADIVIPSMIKGKAVTRINQMAFLSRPFNSVDIPNTVTSIGSGAFYQCLNLTSVTIPDSVTTIEVLAFAGCPNLTDIKIPSSVTSFGDYYVDEVAALLGNLQGIVGYVFEQCPAINYNIKDNVKYIGNDTNPYLVAMGMVDNTVSSLIIADTCKYIHSDAFKQSTNLSSVTIPNSVVSIGMNAFYDCDSLTIIEIPESVSLMGNHVFRDCDNLTICCRATTQPSGWASEWNFNHLPVVWG